MESLHDKEKSRSLGRSWHHRKFWCKDLGIKIFGKILAPKEILVRRSWHHRKFWWPNKFVCNLCPLQVCLFGEQRDICYTPSQKSNNGNHHSMSIFCKLFKNNFFKTLGEQITELISSCNFDKLIFSRDQVLAKPMILDSIMLWVGVIHLWLSSPMIRVPMLSSWILMCICTVLRGVKSKVEQISLVILIFPTGQFWRHGF